MNENIKILISVIIGSIIGGCVVYVIITKPEIIDTVTFNFDEPETIDELKADLNAVGCDTIVILHTDYWKDIKFIKYNDALKLARKAMVVNIPGGTMFVAVTFNLDGESWGWRQPNEPREPDEPREFKPREPKQDAPPP